MRRNKRKKRIIKHARYKKYLDSANKHLTKKKIEKNENNTQYKVRKLRESERERAEYRQTERERLDNFNVSFVVEHDAYEVQMFVFDGPLVGENVHYCCSGFVLIF